VEESGAELDGFSDENDDMDEYLRRLAAWERGEAETAETLLAARGIVVAPPQELSEKALHGRLWELIHALAGMGVYLHNTDHLSDRELYCYLFEEGLRETEVIMPENPNCACYVDLIGTGSQEDIELYLKYYADASDRSSWQADCPGLIIPEHVDPPYDRDRILPKAAF